MNEWMNNPLLKNIAPEKLELIRMAADKTSGKAGRELAPVMMALIGNAGKKGIRFTPDEIKLIIEIIKEGKPEKEQEQIDKTFRSVLSLLQNNSRRQ